MKKFLSCVAGAIVLLLCLVFTAAVISVLVGAVSFGWNAGMQLVGA